MSTFNHFIIMNSAMMPADGIYHRFAIDREAATEWLHKHPAATSYVGYQSTADHIHEISGVEVAVSRAPASLSENTEILVVKLKYRVRDPGQKGRFIPTADDFEYVMVQYIP